MRLVVQDLRPVALCVLNIFYQGTFCGEVGSMQHRRAFRVRSFGGPCMKLWGFENVRHLDEAPRDGKTERSPKLMPTAHMAHRRDWTQRQVGPAATREKKPNKWLPLRKIHTQSVHFKYGTTRKVKGRDMKALSSVVRPFRGCPPCGSCGIVITESSAYPTLKSHVGPRASIASQAMLLYRAMPMVGHTFLCRGRR